MLTLRAARSLSCSFSPFSLTFSPSKHPIKPLFSFINPYANSSHRKSPIRMSTSAAASSSQTIEHIVLFKVKGDTDPTKVNTMINSLNGLIYLEPVLHISAGPLYRTKSSPIPFTHMLHSRHSSKENFNSYAAHPDHVSVAKNSVAPICDDVMALDWVADGFTGPLAPPSGSAIRVTFLKLKDDLGAEVKDEILGVMRGVKQRIGGIDEISCGENFSPARAKGYSIASLAVFSGVCEMEAADSKEELVELQKEKVRGYLESVLVVDYVVSSPQPSSL